MEPRPTTPPETPAAWGQRRASGERPQDPAPPPGAASQGPSGPAGEGAGTREERLADLYGALGADRAGGESGGAPPPRPDLSALFVLLELFRRAAPSELQDRVAALIRELLLTLRSLIDWYLERLDQPAGEPKVEDIPID